MVQNEIETIRALLSSKPRPVGWAERRRRLDDVGSFWPVADDVKLAAVNLTGVPGEWSTVPGSDISRVLMFFHGGGYGVARRYRRRLIFAPQLIEPFDAEPQYRRPYRGEERP